MNTPFDIQQLWNLPTNEFMDLAKQLCVFQASNNPVYKQWIKLSNQSISELETLDAIPFLPISFFKNQDVFIGEKPNTLFESSGTNQDVVSKHWVADTNLYEASFFNCFDILRLLSLFSQYFISMVTAFNLITAASLAAALFSKVNFVIAEM